jgi:hypothetical protein
VRTAAPKQAVSVELFATIDDGDALVEQLRKRAEQIGVSFAVLDELAGLAEGGSAKYLSALQVRQLTTSSLLKLTRALGLRAALFVDPKLVAQMGPSWGMRDATRVHGKRLPRLGAAQLRRILKPAAAELGRRGGVARMAALTGEQRRLMGLRGAQIRWHRDPAGEHKAPDR